MTKEDLEKRHEDYFQDVGKWFISELGKWSKKHNCYVENFGVLRMWFIGSIDTDVYEPYSHHIDDEQKERYKEAYNEYDKLIDDLISLGVDTWQMLIYTDEHQVLH